MSDTSQQTATFDAHTELEEGTRVRAETRHFEFVIDEPESLGGTDAAPNPVEYLLGSLGGCLSIVGRVVADEMAIEIAELTVDLEGDLDPAKFQGADVDSRAGFQEVRASVQAELRSQDGDPVDDETREEWLARVEQRCPVSDNLGGETPIALDLS
ncbi:osmotically inducible protein C [Halorubrum sp. Ib24]|uniref:OsmC family protein n=1 Tax=Halorubrum sp. Ib24 TaxID=1383850 RepID=UPI000B9881C5|nr:OsmC family protein [Halorubrum sp. Ib24]OYR40829.1 osmotically inducible protein C [Halorubrum sp. Ib24]